MQSKRAWLYWLSALLIALAMFFFLRSRGINFTEIARAVGHFPLRRVLEAGALVTFIQLSLQASRLWSLLPLPRQINWWGAVSAFFFGQAVNSFAPARAGDALKLVVMNRESRQKISISAAMGVLLSDKFIDVVSFAIICGAAAPSWSGKVLKLPLAAAEGAAVVLGVLIVGGSVLYFGFSNLRAKIQKLYCSFIGGIREGLRPLRVKKQVALGLTFSVLGWIGEIFAIRALCLGQGYSFSLAECLWPLVVLNIGVALPVAVANLGAFEAAMAFGLSQIGIPVVEGLAIATIHHLLQIIGVYLWAGFLAVTRPRWSRQEAANLTSIT